MAATRRPPRPVAPGRLGRVRLTLGTAALPGRRRRAPLAPGMAFLVLGLVLALSGCRGSGGPAGGPVVPRETAQGPPWEAAQDQPGPPPGRRAAAGQGMDPGGRQAGLQDPAGPRPGVDVPGVPPAPAGFEVAGVPRRLAVPGPPSPPVRLAIPSIAVATPLVRLGRERDGGMQVPADFARAGWFAEGPPPGAVGPAVIAGHVDSRTGPAVFFRLRELRQGDPVEVERADGTRLVFVVEQARSYPKAAFPTAAVFGPAPWAALRLVTCGGDFDRARGSYRDNLVVFARLARVAR